MVLLAPARALDTMMLEQYSMYDQLEMEDSLAADPAGRLEEVNRWWGYIKANAHG